MRSILALAATAVLFIGTAAFADNISGSSAVSVSKNHNRNNVSNSVSNSIKDRLQAPGLSVGSSYCNDSFGISGPGFGIGASTMTRVCKQEKTLGMAERYYGRTAARQVGCETVSEFRSLPHCVGLRIERSRQIQLRDRRNARR